jgi:hypothetical protein
LENSQSASNEKVQIVGLGNIVVKKDRGLRSLSIESFFPSTNNQFYTGVSPKTCVDFINKIWASEKIPRIVTEGLPINLNMFFVIDEFNPDNKAGEEEDIYYTLSITEYIPYGAKIINMQGTTNNGIISSLNRVDTKPLINQVYTVVSGDSLISITKKITGNSSSWKELYNENTAVIGNNPTTLTPGVKLTLPESWVVS